MGGRQSKQSSLFDQKQWTLIQSDQQQLFTNVNTYATRALRNHRNNTEIQEYQLEFSSENDYLAYAKELRLRKEPGQQILSENNHEGYYYLSPYIYTVKYFVNDTVEDMCSTVYKARLYAQKVDLRLKEINDIPFPDHLYLTKASLQGFKVLYQKMGYFDICEQMIFINKLGQIKVWIHPNISMNHPYYYPSNSREPQGSQADMIVKLLDIIEENTDQYNHETQHFRDYLLNKNLYDRLSFYKALEEFQLYCVQEHLQVDEAMRSIYELYHPMQEEKDLATNGYHLQATMQQGPNLRQRTPSRQRSFTPIKQKQFQLANNDHSVRMASGTINNLLYNSHASNRNIAPRETNIRPQYQSMQKNLYPSNNTKLDIPQFNNIPSLHIRGYSNQISSKNNQSSHPAFVGPLKSTSIKNQDSFRAMSHQNTSERRSQLINNQRTVQANRSNNFIKFNYGSANGTISPLIQIKPNQNQPSSKNLIQSYFPPIQTKQLYTQVPLPQKQAVFAQPSRQATIPVSSFSNSHPQYKQYDNRLPSNLNTMKSIQNESVPSVVESQHKSSGGSKVTYYSANEVYNLDSEIASDLEAFLGYNTRT